MSNDELRSLQKSLDQFISINSFLSTSADYWKTPSYFDICAKSNDSEEVLFKIDADSVAGGQTQRNNLTQLSGPQGIIIDQSNNVYVADSEYDRIMRWSIGSKETTIIAGGNGQGKQSNQLNGVRGLSFDIHGNLYIVDYYNHRVQKFSFE